MSSHRHAASLLLLLLLATTFLVSSPLQTVQADCNDSGCSSYSSAAESALLSVTRTVDGETYSFDHCKSVTYGEVCWITVGSNITIAYTYGPWSGYVAIGFSQSGTMVTSTAVIGWTGSSPFIDNFDLNSYSENYPGATTLELTNASVSTNATGYTTILFTRPLTLTGTSKPFANISPTGSNVILQTHGTLPTSNTTVQQHIMPPGVDTLTFAAAGVTASSSTGSNALPVVRVIDGVTYTFDFCESLTYGELCWLTVGDVITIAYSCSTSGWVGLGFSSDGNMVGSSAVIGWAGDSAYVDDYYLANQNNGGNSPGTALSLINKSVSIDSTGLTTILFSRPLTLPSTSSAASFGSISMTGSNTLIEAHGPLPSGPTSVSYHGANSRTADSVSFASGTVVQVKSNIDSWKSAHAAMMALAFGLFFPLGIIFARFFKGYGPIWFHLHRIFVLSGVALLIVGFAIGINKIGTGYYTTHRGIGIYVFSAFMFQVLNALVRPHAPVKGEQTLPLRVAWEQLHHWNARIGYVLAIVNIGLGFGILDPATKYMVVFWVLWGCVMVSAIGLQLWVLLSGQQLGVSGEHITPAIVGNSTKNTPVTVEQA